jgi:hypothetical protein
VRIWSGYVFFFAVLLYTCVAAVQAGAGTIDPVSFDVFATHTGGGFAYCGTSVPCTAGPTESLLLLPSTGPDGAPYSGSSIATAEFSPVPKLIVSASVSAAQLELDGPEASEFNFTAGGSMTYYFELTQTAGPANSGPIPVLMNGTSSLSSVSGTENESSSNVSMQVSTADGSTILYTLPTANSAPYFQTVDIVPDVEYSVTMTASVAAQVIADEFTTHSLSASATIDPIFTVAPDYTADYLLNFSDTIGDGGSATPEPASWLTMLAGIGGLAAVVRLRRLPLRNCSTRG